MSHVAGPCLHLLGRCWRLDIERLERYLPIQPCQILLEIQAWTWIHVFCEDKVLSVYRDGLPKVPVTIKPTNGARSPGLKVLGQWRIPKPSHQCIASTWLFILLQSHMGLIHVKVWRTCILESLGDCQRGPVATFTVGRPGAEARILDFDAVRVISDTIEIIESVKESLWLGSVMHVIYHYNQAHYDFLDFLNSY